MHLLVALPQVAQDVAVLDHSRVDREPHPLGEAVGPVWSTSAARTPEAHCGYAAKSAITAMMTGRGASIVMVELVLSAMLGAYLLPCPTGTGPRGRASYHWSTYGVPLALK